MEARKLILAVVALTAGGAALAQTQEPKTRAEVRAAAAAAVKAGTIQVGDGAGMHDPLPVSSRRSRAEVRAEGAAPHRARTGELIFEDGPLPDVAGWTPSTLSRTQVVAEAIEARRLGLISRGEAEARSPTPLEQEFVRQAGLRAIGMENMVRR